MALARLGPWLEQPHLPIYLLLFLLAMGKVAIFSSKLPPGMGPDEVAHASMARAVLDDWSLVPRFDSTWILNQDLSPSTHHNYVFHPPFVYRSLIALAGMQRVSSAPDLDQLIFILRKATLRVAILVIVVFMVVGLSVDMNPSGHLLYATVVTSVPITLISATTVSNDGFALLGGGLTCLGLVRLAQQKRFGSGCGLIAVGVTVGGLAKLTAAMLCMAAVAWTVVLWFLFGRERGTRSMAAALAVALTFGSVVPCLYYAAVWKHYGTVQPSLRTVAPDEFKTTDWYTLDDGVQPQSFTRWTMTFAYLLGMSWVNPVLQGAFLDRGSPAEVAGLLVVPLLAVVGVIFGLRRSYNARRLPLALIGCLLAVVSVAVIHLVVSYCAHIATGYVGGVQARYYLPMLPAIAIAGAHGIKVLPRPWQQSIVAGLVTSSLLFSDFFSILSRAATLTW